MEKRLSEIEYWFKQEGAVNPEDIEWLIQRAKQAKQYEDNNRFCCNKAMGYLGLGQYQCHVCGNKISE